MNELRIHLIRYWGLG